MKSLKELSLPITEEQYREDGYIHHSTLSNYERGGFNAIPTLFEKKESPSLLFGSIVDCLITEAPEEFEKRYLVADFSQEASDTLINVTKGLFGIYKESYTNLSDIPEAVILASLDEVNYGKTWKPRTRVDKLINAGSEYYKLLLISQDKTIVASEMFNDAMACVRALHESPATKQLFATDNPFEKVERCYQAKFRGTFNGLTYSIMADLIIVFHDKKKILPIDLKTSSHKEWDFYQSFIDWNYSVQGRLYYRVLKQNLEKDDYFKDFEILNWHFVTVNKTTLTPLVWEYEDTKKDGTLYYGKDSQIICRDPFELAEELQYYLDTKPSVPIGIHLDKPNSLINKLAEL